MLIRRAETIYDIDKMIELGAQMHADSRFASMPYDKVKLRSYGHLALGKPDDWGVFIAEDKTGEVQAMIAVYVSPFYFTDERKHTNDFFLYVAKGKRGGIAAARCVKAVEAWAAEVGVNEIQFGITAGIDDDAAERLYRALGYNMTGRIMTKGVQ
jgi:GNAT superfamily N-acetyltransferase